MGFQRCNEAFPTVYVAMQSWLPAISVSKAQVGQRARFRHELNAKEERSLRIPNPPIEAEYPSLVHPNALPHGVAALHRRVEDRHLTADALESK